MVRRNTVLHDAGRGHPAEDSDDPTGEQMARTGPTGVAPAGAVTAAPLPLEGEAGVIDLRHLGPDGAPIAPVDGAAIAQALRTDVGDERETGRPAPHRLGPLSWYARRGKVDFFLGRMPKDGIILDVGCADNWFKRAAADRGWSNVVGLDLEPSADIVGDLRSWRGLGLRPHSIDAIVAFEVVEHGDFSEPLHDLLKPDGQLIITTPVPRMDPVCRLLEAFRLLQRRTSPHTHLVDVRRFPRFSVVERHVRAGVSQWAILRPQ